MSQEPRTPAGRRAHAAGLVPGLDVIFLGTGARWPTPERGVAAAIVARGGEHLLVDCGEGTQIQMMRSTAGLGRLTAILLTHLHADHVLGLPGLLATLADGRRTPLAILGPQGTLALLEGFRPHFGGLGFPLGIREMSPGECDRRVGYRLIAVAARHRTPRWPGAWRRTLSRATSCPSASARSACPLGPHAAGSPPERRSRAPAAAA